MVERQVVARSDGVEWCGAFVIGGLVMLLSCDPNILCNHWMVPLSSASSAASCEGVQVVSADGNTAIALCRKMNDSADMMKMASVWL